MSILNSTVDQSLSPLVKAPIEREQLRRYAAASGDHNPIHLDDAAARRVGLNGVIAHGMLSMAFLGQFVNQQIADDPGARVGRLKVRYIAMVYPGDTLTCLGKVTARAEGETETAITLECWAQNQRGEKVATGEATVHVPHR
ncbi:MAG TPA: MaoC/PaaZ C-terminal domain-containing protein [Ktedonobacteraceae bacterium]|jgi:acyl dehydratase|nr:MaoC/PaaZ C-terminal domain-containing protein [Ktedonobacteraceae bacterium]